MNPSHRLASQMPKVQYSTSILRISKNLGPRDVYSMKQRAHSIYSQSGRIMDVEENEILHQHIASFTPNQAETLTQSNSIRRTWNPSRGIKFASALTQDTLGAQLTRSASVNNFTSNSSVCMSEKADKGRVQISDNNGRIKLEDQRKKEDGSSGVQTSDISEQLSRINLRASPKLQNPSLVASSSADDVSVISLDSFILSSNGDPALSHICGESNAVDAGIGHENIGNSSSGLEVKSDLLDYATLSFRIPEEVLRKAITASPTSGTHYWQHALYRGPNGERVKIHYCKSLETTERVAQLFLDEEVIGFDIEWRINATLKDGARKNVSLIQIASVDRIALFHLGLYPKRDGECVDDLVAPSLKKIMESSNITKAGVAIKADCTRLRKYLGIQSQGLFELSHLYRLVKYSTTDVTQINKKLVQLAVIVEEHLQLPLWKGEVRSSDWSQSLDHRQISYAASDSYAGLHLYDIMENKRKTMNPSPPRPAHAELNLPIRLCGSPTSSVSTESSEDSIDIEDDSDLASSSAISDNEQVADEIVAISTESPCIVEDTPAPAESKAFRSPEVVSAEEWVASWRASLPSKRKIFATPASLRAYAIWHHGHHSVSQSASLLRTPPLQSSTVAKYIMDAIRSENLEYEPNRLREVANIMPKDIFATRYRDLNQRLFYF